MTFTCNCIRSRFLLNLLYTGMGWVQNDAPHIRYGSSSKITTAEELKVLTDKNLYCSIVKATPRTLLTLLKVYSLTGKHSQHSHLLWPTSAHGLTWWFLEKKKPKDKKIANSLTYTLITYMFIHGHHVYLCSVPTTQWKTTGKIFLWLNFCLALFLAP